MTIINQTNRTLLLEEINPEKLDLLTLIGDVKGIDSLSDDKIKEINQYLECRSYEEFQEKFAPCIYSFFDANTQSVRYTLKKPENIPENMLTEIPLNQSNDFLKMLFTLMESKKSQGVLNVDFGFENLLDMISPKKVMDDIRQVRKEIRYNYAKYAELEDGDPAKLDVGDKLNELFEEASNNYNNVMAMLPLAIEDIKTRLLLGAGGQQGGGNQIALGKLYLQHNDSPLAEASCGSMKLSDSSGGSVALGDVVASTLAQSQKSAQESKGTDKQAVPIITDMLGHLT